MKPILEPVMPRWYESANEASFKAIAGGHVFQAPSPWMFARPSYYLVNDAQKAQLLACLGRWRLLLLIVTAIDLALTFAITLPMTVAPGTFGRLFRPVLLQLGPGLFTLLLCAVMLALVMPLYAVPQIYLARKFRALLADAPRTAERISVAEQLPRIAASVSGKILVCGLIGGLAMIGVSLAQMFDAFLAGHLARNMPSSAAIFIAGALLSSYFVYLMRLKRQPKHTAIG
jgi:hypothetical protein